MALTQDEKDTIRRLEEQYRVQWILDERNSRYFEGTQRLKQIGLAVPPQLRMFEVAINWPRVVVETLEQRQDVKALYRAGADVADSELLALYRANNLDADLPLYLRERYILGRGVLAVGTNADGRDSPLITVESPRDFVFDIDRPRRRIRAALQRAVNDLGQPTEGALYLPDVTVYLERTGERWVEVDRDEHELGRVPLVLGLNRRRTGVWTGRSEMSDVIPLADMASRVLTDEQLAVESLAVPLRYFFGVKAEDFVDPITKEPIPAWEAYYGKFMAHADKDITAGQLPAADLSGFHEAITNLGKLCSSVTGFPEKYWGIHTANPASEGAIRADESRLVKTVERKNVEVGVELSWALGIAERLRTGEWPDDAQRSYVEWHNPATPTFSEKADALQKLAGGVPILSREGAWDEMGWSEGRKRREREYFERESTSSAYLGLITEKDQLDADVGAEPAVDGA